MPKAICYEVAGPELWQKGKLSLVYWKPGRELAGLSAEGREKDQKSKEGENCKEGAGRQMMRDIVLLSC